MRKELGKWLMDVAKYVTTAILLTSVFSDMRSIWMYIGAAVVILTGIVLGLILIQDKKEELKEANV
jgi:hypothetical protein